MVSGKQCLITMRIYITVICRLLAKFRISGEIVKDQFMCDTLKHKHLESKIHYLYVIPRRNRNIIRKRTCQDRRMPSGGYLGLCPSETMADSTRRMNHSRAPEYPIMGQFTETSDNTRSSRFRRYKTRNQKGLHWLS